MRIITEILEKDDKDVLENFTDREEPRDLFWESFEKLQKTGDIQVVSYSGLGGIGKSEILRKLQQEIAERSPASKVEFVDFERTVEFNHDTLDILKLIKAHLEENYKFKFPIFDLVAYTYDVKMGKPASRKELNTILNNHPTLGIISKTADVIGIFSPINGIISGAKILLEQTGKVIDGVDNAQGIAHSLSKIFCSKEFIQHSELIDKSTPEELKQDLSYYFAIDLTNNLKKETAPFVFFIDTFEKLVNEFTENDATSKDLWLRGRNGLILRVPNVIWVIAGREKLTWKKIEDKKLASNLISRNEYLNWSEALAEYDLSAFRPSDAEKYLRAAGINDDELIPGIIKYTLCNPYHLSLCVNMYYSVLSANRKPVLKDFEGGDDVLANRLLCYTTKDERDFITMLAFQPNWTDENIGEISKRYVGAYHASLYETVKHMSFVVNENGTYKIHDNAKHIIVANASPAVRRQFESARAAEVEEKLSQAVITHTISTATSSVPEPTLKSEKSTEPESAKQPTKPDSAQQLKTPAETAEPAQKLTPEPAQKPVATPATSTTAPKETFAQTLEFMYSELSSAPDHATFSSRAYDFIKQVRIYQETFEEIYKFRFHDIENFKGTFEYRCVTTLAFSSQNVGGLTYIPDIAKRVETPDNKKLFVETLKVAAMIVGFDRFDDVRANRCNFIRTFLDLIKTHLGTKDFYYWYVYRNFLCFEDNNFMLDYLNFRGEKPVYNKFFLALDMAFLSDCAEHPSAFHHRENKQDFYIDKGVKNLHSLLPDMIFDSYDFIETEQGFLAKQKELGPDQKLYDISPQFLQTSEYFPRHLIQTLILPEIEAAGGNTKLALRYFVRYAKKYNTYITRYPILDVADASMPLFLATSDLEIFNSFFNLYLAIPGLGQKQTKARIDDFFKVAIDRSIELFGEYDIYTLILKGRYYTAIAPEDITPHVEYYLKLRDKFGVADDRTITQLITLYRIINGTLENATIVTSIPKMSLDNTYYDTVKRIYAQARLAEKFQTLEPYYLDLLKHKHESTRIDVAIMNCVIDATIYTLNANYDLMLPNYCSYALNTAKTTLKLTQDCFKNTDDRYYRTYQFVLEYFAQQTFQNYRYIISPAEYLAKPEPIEDFDFYLPYFSNKKFIDSANKCPKTTHFYHYITALCAIVTRYLIADELSTLNVSDVEYQNLRELCLSFNNSPANIKKYFGEHPEFSKDDCYKIILVAYYLSSNLLPSDTLFANYLDDPKIKIIFNLIKSRVHLTEKSLKNSDIRNTIIRKLKIADQHIKNPRALKYLIYLEKILDLLKPREES